MLMLRAALCVAAIFLLTLSAYAAIELDPGQWQDTETGEEDGKPVAPQVTSDCMSPDEAKDPVKQLAVMKDASAGQCEKLDFKQNGNTVAITMLCGDPKEMRFDLSGTYTFTDRKNYTGTMKSVITVAGKTATANKTVVSKWLGPCKAPAGKK